MSGIVIIPKNNGSAMQGLKWREQFLGFYSDPTSFANIFNIFSHLTVAGDENVILCLVRLNYNPVTNVMRQYYERYKWAKGAGTFSPIGNVTIGTDIIFESSNLIASAADANLPNTVIRNLGNLAPSANFIETINFGQEGIDLSDVTKTYLVQFIQDGIAHLYVFRGSESSQGYGIYGDGFMQCIEGDFYGFTDSGQLPEPGETKPFEIKGVFANNTAALAGGLEPGDIYQLNASADISLLAVVMPGDAPALHFAVFTFDDLAATASNMGVMEIGSVSQWNAAINDWNSGTSDVNFTECQIEGNTLRLGGNVLSVTRLDLSETGLVAVELYELVNLEYLDLSHNMLTEEIEFFRWPSNREIYLNHNNFESINVSASSTIRKLVCNNNSLTYLNIGTPYIEEVNASFNPSLGSIIGMNICFALISIDASGCALTSIDCSNLPALVTMRVRANSIVNIFFGASPNLMDLRADNNQIDDFGPMSIIKTGATINLRQNSLPEAKISTALEYIYNNPVNPASVDMDGPGNAVLTGEVLDMYNTLVGSDINVTCNT